MRLCRYWVPSDMTTYYESVYIVSLLNAVGFAVHTNAYACLAVSYVF